MSRMLIGVSTGMIGPAVRLPEASVPAEISFEPPQRTLSPRLEALTDAKYTRSSSSELLYLHLVMILHHAFTVPPHCSQSLPPTLPIPPTSTHLALLRAQQ